MQILDGILLNAWRHESGHHDLGDFAATEPLAEDLLKLAGNILLKHATPMATLDTLDKTLDGDYESDDLDSEADLTEGFPNALLEVSTTSLPSPDRDKAHQNLQLLTRDLLYVAKLVRAISDGNIGCIEDMMSMLSMMFWGASSNNYCTEILHFILNLKHVWTPEFAYVTSFAYL